MVCGDGRCGAGEIAACPQDCGICRPGDKLCLGKKLRVCDDLEDRANCPRDCGFCGDAICQDGAETSNLNPPANLESCVSDCVVVGCQQATDCDDGVACTANGCVNNTCVYTAQTTSARATTSASSSRAAARTPTTTATPTSSGGDLPA